ncbi:acetyl-CoA synthetase-like protein [Hyaloscypha variabilis]
MAFSSEATYLTFVNNSFLSLASKAAFTAWAERANRQFQTRPSKSTFSEILDAIPTLENSGTIPLASLGFLLSRYPEYLPTFDILRCYGKLWLGLPNAIKAKQRGDETAILQEVLAQVKASCDYLPSLFLTDSVLPALIDPTSQRSLTHQQLAFFVQTFRLPLTASKVSPRPVVALALPNGFQLGLACLAVAAYYTAAPLNIAGGAAQFQSDVELARPDCILVLESDVERLRIREPWVSEAGIQVLLLTPNEDMTFHIKPLCEMQSFKYLTAPTPNSPDDFALILFTSGTSGTKKVVPITYFGLLTGLSCVVDSWGLTSKDSCVNMMPLNHVGGIVRNLFAPVLSGGSTILCSAFDPNLFWDLLEDGHGTWYYASPSMHISILAEGRNRGDAASRSRLRLVCNAAGSLLPALAAQLRHTFKCTVLPSYGMTECMPISTPPLNYQLDRNGTSGIGCGPEIGILDKEGVPVPSGTVGHISVRGGPTFPGYLKNGKIDTSVFNSDGWFDTGDLGSLDQDGYLYLTGRGKEVINRGGEIISPFEVEEAITIATQNNISVLSGRIRQAMAFSAPHELLQEVVGVVLLTVPNQPRPDIRDLQTALKHSLHSSKWPAVVVYMDALPISNNKLMRINFAQRMGMSPVKSNAKLIERHFEALCPPVNSPLSTKISSSPSRMDLELVLREMETVLDPNLEAHVRTSHCDGTTVIYLAPRTDKDSKALSEYDIEMLSDQLRRPLDGFLLPSKIHSIKMPFPRNALGLVDEKQLENMVHAQISAASIAGSETEEQIRRAFSRVLDFDIEEISSDSNFFELGGDSLSAGQLLSLLRRDLQVRIPVDQLFTSSKVHELCKLVDQLASIASEKPTLCSPPIVCCTERYSSTHPLVLLIHLLPLVLVYPMKQAFKWTFLMYALSSISEVWDEPNIPSRFLALVFCMMISRLATQIMAPIVGISFKWLVIGKYQEGMYPMWGVYHTRWWIVEKVLLICGKGVFQYLEETRILYYRLLGARIGKGVTIEKGTVLGEFDLLDIGDNVRLDKCVCRPFAVEVNTSMYLGRITIGANSNIGLKSHTAAGSTIPPDTFIGANSSSYEMDDAAEFNNSRKPKPHILTKLFYILPIQLLHVAVRPFVRFGLILIIKKAVNRFCGVSRPISAEDQTQTDIFRSQLLAALGKNLDGITKLFGKHYEFTSVAVRALGGKVGQRVYWPGTGPSIDDIDLLDVGDDVVFGSRSHIITSDASGSDFVRIGDGAMIADRVVLNPGATVGDGAVIGSGAFIKRGQNCTPGSVWVGNRKGSAVCLSNPSSCNQSKISRRSCKGPFDSARGNSLYPSSLQGNSGHSSPPPSYPRSEKSPTTSTANVGTVDVTMETFGFVPNSVTGGTSISSSIYKEPLSPSSPFGRAFYEGKAPYHVLGQKTIFLYSTFTAIFVQFYWNVSTISTVIISQLLTANQQFSRQRYKPLRIYLFAVAFLSALYTLLALLALLITIGAKWLLHGRRKAGSYDWDKSSYCQRWQLLLTIEAIRRRCFGGNGVLGMLTGSHFIVLYFRALGAKIGKDCALFAGGRPSLVFTEPDLLTLGDRVVIDDASLVGHINSRGRFSLNELRVGSGSAGDVADDGGIYQGWPADVFRGDRLRVRSRRS